MELRPFSLDGKTAVVTGASRGIGHAVARVFAQAGADLALVARSQEPLETLAKQIREMGRRALVCPLDVTNWEGIPATMDRVREEYGHIDILVNNAGVWHKGFVDDLTVESWDRMFDTNVKSVFLFCQAVAPIMRQQRWGRIINMGSLAAFTTGLVGAGDYAASKAALHTFTKSLARDLGPDGITANVIAPGQIETEMTAITDEEQIKRVVSMVPVRRVGQPEDIAYAALYLASEEAGYVTGAILDVNGGILKR